MIILNIHLIKIDMRNIVDVSALWSRVYKSCAQKGIKVSELEARCNLPRTTISVARSRNSMPYIDRAYAICKELGITCEYLVTGEKSPEDNLTEIRSRIKDYDLIVNKLMSDPLYHKIVSAALDMNKAQLLGLLGLISETGSEEYNG